MDYAIGGIGVAALVIGIVQAAKDFGLTSRRGKQALALVTSFLLVGLTHGISEGLVPTAYVPYVVWGITALTGGLTAMGWYSLTKKLIVDYAMAQEYLRPGAAGSNYNYLIIVHKDEELQRWVIDQDSEYILDDEGGNCPILELQVHTIRAIMSEGR